MRKRCGRNFSSRQQDWERRKLRNRVRNKATIAACLLACLLCSACAQEDYRGRTVRLFGTIRDTQGQPVNGAKCRVSILSSFGRDLDPPDKSLDVNGSYDVTCDHVLDVGASIRKDGYYPVGFSYQLANVDKETSSVNGVQTIQHDVVLEPMLTGLPDLDDYAQWLGPAAGFKMVMMDLRDLAIRKNLRRAVITTNTETLDYPYTSNSLRLGYPYLAADLLPQPGVQRACEDMSVWRKPPHPVSPKDAVAQLCMCEAGTTDGLILAPASWLPDASDLKRTRFPREMQEAPADGYQPTISIPADAFVDRSKKRVFFFLRCGGIYGKGWLTGMQYSGQDGTWNCDIKLRINPTGSRDLKTHPKETD
jgi:hypothetical protein